MAHDKQTTALSLTVLLLIVMIGGCSNWLTSQPVSPVLQPLVAQASPTDEYTIPEPLVLGVAWLRSSDGAKAIPERATQKLLKQIREHYSEPGISLQVSSIDHVSSVDLSILQQLGQQHGVTHMLVVAPTVQEIIIPEKFAVPKAGLWLGTRTESQVFLEAVAVDLKTGLPLFEAQGNGQAAHEALDNGAFGYYPRIFRGIYPPGHGNFYYPEGSKEKFRPDEVRVFASNFALAGLLEKLDRVKIANSHD